MIPRTPVRLHTPDRDWRQILAEGIASPLELCQALGLSPDELDPSPLQDSPFATRVPRPWLKNIEPGNPRDPLLRQVLATVEEERSVAGYVSDPVEDLGAQVIPGLLHKYHGRALIISTGACAIHCRYCFRRHFPYAASMARDSHWPAIVAWLRQHPDIGEVILSGGDPLGLGNDRLGAMINDLEGIDHLHTLRLHSRIPVVLPERLDPGLRRLLGCGRLQRVLVLHVNHPREMGSLSADTLSSLAWAGVTLLNQAVLLRGVNNHVDTLEELSHTLFRHSVLPYYLHQLDPVAAAHHFQVSDREAKTLHQGLAARLPGYLLPRLVREYPGAPGKSPLGSQSD